MPFRFPWPRPFPTRADRGGDGGASSRSWPVFPTPLASAASALRPSAEEEEGEEEEGGADDALVFAAFASPPMPPVVSPPPMMLEAVFAVVSPTASAADVVFLEAACLSVGSLLALVLVSMGCVFRVPKNARSGSLSLGFFRTLVLVESLGVQAQSKRAKQGGWLGC